MENASKALLIAAGTLMALLTISLLVIMFNKISDTQRSMNLDSADQTTIEFNNQFGTYNNERVRGSELYSCLGRAIDYNKRNTYQAGEEDHNSRSSRYMPITINTTNISTIELKWTAFSSNLLFTKDSYKIENVVNEFQEVTDEIKDLENKYSGSEKLMKLVTEIGAIFSGPTSGTNETEILADIKKLEKFEKIFNNDIDKIRTYIGSRYKKIVEFRPEFSGTIRSNIEFNLNLLKDTSNEFFKDVAKYYEYVQFKRAIFECTKCKYDEKTGRITDMEFKPTGEFN